MKKISSLLTTPALLAVALLLNQARPAHADLAWNANMADAMNQAGQSGEPLMIDVYAPSSDKSGRLDSEVFVDPTVARLSTRFVVVRINGTDPSNAGLNDQFHVTGYPTLIFLDVRHHKILSELGFVDAPTLSQNMKTVLAESDQLNGGGSPPPAQNLPVQSSQLAQPSRAPGGPTYASAGAVQPAPARGQNDAGQIVAHTSASVARGNSGAGGVVPVQNGIFLLDDTGVVQRLDAPAPSPPAKAAAPASKPVPASANGAAAKGKPAAAKAAVKPAAKPPAATGTWTPE